MSRNDTRPPASADPASRGTSRGLAIATIVLGTMISTLANSITSIALPAMAAELGASPSASIWIVNAYQLAVTVSLLPLASLGDIHGYRVVYLWGLALFTAASLGCGLAGRVRFHKNGPVSELHVEFHEHQFADYEFLLLRLQFRKEAARFLMLRRIRVGRVDEEVGIRGQHGITWMGIVLPRHRLPVGWSRDLRGDRRCRAAPAWSTDARGLLLRHSFGHKFPCPAGSPPRPTHHAPGRCA